MSCQSLPGSCLARRASLLVHPCTWQLSYGGRISFRGRSGRIEPLGMRKEGFKGASEQASERSCGRFHFRIPPTYLLLSQSVRFFAGRLFGALSGGMAAFYHLPFSSARSPVSSRRHDFQANLLVRCPVSVRSAMHFPADGHVLHSTSPWCLHGIAAATNYDASE